MKLDNDSRIAKKLLFMVAALLVSLSLWEGALALMLRGTGLSRPFVPVMRHIYVNNIWFPQFKPGIGRYDPELSYTLVPGTHAFSTSECSMVLSVNHMGLRDDEELLQAPEIIVLGDSVAMGYGVRRDQSFPKILEMESGRRVLNAGIASYGTVRELRLLRRLDRSRLRVLVIQYSNNDYFENQEFSSRGNSYRPMDLASYRFNVKLNADRARYYPGKYVLQALRFALIEEPKAIHPIEEIWELQSVENFLNVLSAESAADLSRIKVIVFGVVPWGARGRFAEIFNKKKMEPRWPQWVRNSIAVDLSHFLTPDKYFLLDDHPNAEGHSAIAEALLPYLAP